MAAFNITPPEPFLFSQLENWEKWIRHFDRFRKSSGMAEKPEPDQVNTVAEDILLSFRLTGGSQEILDSSGKISTILH